MRPGVTLALALAVAGTTFAQQAQYQKSGPALMPDSSITKGAVRLRS